MYPRLLSKNIKLEYAKLQFSLWLHISVFRDINEETQTDSV
jgi:hypothetical protein